LYKYWMDMHLIEIWGIYVVMLNCNIYLENANKRL
jgi:hypothetical protein